MSILFVYHVATPDTPNKVLTHADDIASTLAEHGVGFERWQANTRVEAGASAAEVTAAYQGPIDSWMTAQGYAHVEVLSVSREHPQRTPLLRVCAMNIATMPMKSACSPPGEGCSACTSAITSSRYSAKTRPAAHPGRHTALV